MPQIQISSILGGHSPTTHFGGAGQFRASLGIDPAQPIDDADGVFSTIGSGLLRPAATEKFSGTTINTAPLWMIPNPKDALVYVYDARGSAYTIDAAFATVTALADGETLTASLGNGAEYYDNYIYFAKNLTIARYGPLNGTPAFNGNYWTTTLSKTDLTNTAYPTTFKNNLQIPNHVMHRHSDGVLYFADVVGNQGVIHKINTTKTTVEGDTDNGSTYNALDFPWGLWPTEIETYGTDLAIALYEGSNGNLRQSRAKIAFWDTTATNFNKLVFVEFPDQIITAMKNVNGTLYVISGNINARGFRVTAFLGGYSFKEVFYSETGEPCLSGAIDGTLNRVLFGSHTTVPEPDGCVYSVGLQKASLGSGFFNVMRATGGTSSTNVTSLSIADNNEMGFVVPVIGWTQAGEGSAGVSHGLDKQGTVYGTVATVWWSDLYRLGQPFKITKIRIPLAQAIATNMTIIPKIYTDEGTKTYTLTTMNNTNYSGKKNIVIRPENLTGDHNFMLELRWTGTALCTVGLPIIVEYELLND